ncbi:MAG TPA: hypothetical protein VKH81_20310 [Candidatus Angelobacter sp.]|nr:hypothetical protein [Candidatus Angelobacter sp.]
MLRRHVRTVSAVVLAAAGFAAATSMRQAVKPFSVYHDGDDLIFTPEAAGTRKLAAIGPWNLGERLGDDRPADRRLNLYVVVPGVQYRSSGKAEYDHNLIINKYTVDGKPRDWDVFWCFILDPSLRPDLRSERELLLAKHQTFRPSALFEFKDVPSHAVMAERLGVKSLADMKRFRRKDGTLPRLLILPARLAVRATAEIRDVTITHPREASAH